jgi:hypothetical protein
MYTCKLQSENHKQQSWKQYQATECEDIQVKAEDHGITWWTMNFHSPKEILKLIQQILSCHSSWAYKTQQTVSDIDLETTPGFHKLQKEVKICKGIPTASTYLNPAPCIQTKNSLRSYL